MKSRRKVIESEKQAVKLVKFKARVSVGPGMKKINVTLPEKIRELKYKRKVLKVDVEEIEKL